MADTKPKFFEALGRAGFKYTRLSDGLMRPVRPIFAIFFSHLFLFAYVLPFSSRNFEELLLVSSQYKRNVA